MSAPAFIRRTGTFSHVVRQTSVLTQPWVAVAALTFLGFMLRRYHLGNESLWFDEADIVRRAAQSLPVLTTGFTQAGENGPLYTLLLHFWLSLAKAVPALSAPLHILFGQGDEAIPRALSAVFGTAAIPAMYALGKRLSGAGAGIVAAGMLTFNPFHIWHSQDAKMYALFVFVSLLSSVLYYDALQSGGVRLWAGYVVATWVMLTVHSMGGLVLLAQLIATPLAGIARPRFSSTPAGTAENASTEPTLSPPPRTRIVRWGWAILLIAGPLFPIAWLRAAALFTGTASVGGWYLPTGLGDILSTIFVKFAVNRAPEPWEAVGGLLLLLFAVLGAFALARLNRTSAAYLALLWVVPVVAFWVLTLKIPLFQPRYLIMSLPPYLIFAAAGLISLRKLHPFLSIAGAALLAVPTLIALSSVNYAPQVQKEDWRGAMAYVQDHLRGRDVIVVFPGYLVTAVDYYYKPGGSALVPQVDIKTIPSLRTEGFRDADLNAALREAVNCHERAWLITSPPRQEQEDPSGKVQEWFQYNWHTFDTRVFNGVTVYGISFNGQPGCWYPAPDHKERYTFTNGLQFLGYIYELRREDERQPDASVLPLTLYWRNKTALPLDYDVRIAVKGPLGATVEDEALGPLNGYWPTSSWAPDTPVIDYRDIRLPGGLQPGDYTISLQLYAKGSNEPLKLTDGTTEIRFTEPVHVVPWKP